MVAIAADPQGDWPTRVLVSVTGLTVGDSIQLYRSVGGERTEVRAGSDDSVADTSFLRTDAELPFGIPVSYIAVVNDSDEYSTAATTYTLEGGKVALTDAINGNSAEAVIMAWPEQNYQPQTSLFKVGGRNVVVSGDVGMFEGDIELYLENTSSVDNVTSLVRNATEGTVQIRQPGGYDGVDAYVAILGMSKKRFSQDGSDPRRTIVLNVAEVEGWAPGLEAQGTTLQDIADAYDSPPTLVKQWTFATNTESWGTYSGVGTLARVATPSSVGDGSLRYTPPGGLAPVGVSSPLTVLTGTGEAFAVELLFQSVSGLTDLRGEISWRNSGGTEVGITPQNQLGPVAAGSWTTLTFSGLKPSTATRFILYLWTGEFASATNLLYFDYVKVEQVSSLDDLSDDYATLLDIAQGEFS